MIDLSILGMTTVEITNLMVILGVLASIITAIIKAKIGTEGWQTLLMVASIAIFFSCIYYVLVQTNYLKVVLSILAIAGAFYTFFIERLKKS